MEDLFDLNKPFFAAWVKLHDVDLYPGASSPFYRFCHHDKSGAAPLYYAALCGFHDLAKHLIRNYPQQVNAHGGCHVTPLVAALAKEHFEVAELLLRNGAGSSVNVRGNKKRIPLHTAVLFPEAIAVVRFLLKHDADINSKDEYGWTPLYHSVEIENDRGSSKHPQLAAYIPRILLENGADVNARTYNGNTPLHKAALNGYVNIARILLKHGANVDEKNNEGTTPYQSALASKQKEMAKLLSKHGAKSSR